MRFSAALAAALAAAFVLAAAPGAATALDADRAQPATLEADDFELDLATGVRTYRGGVVFRQGTLRLDCDALVTYHSGEELDKGVCSGNPGRFKQRPEGRDADLVGRARAITLDRAGGVVVFEGEADVELGGDRIQGRVITYDLDSRKVRVSGAAEGGGARPRLIIQPRGSPN